MAAKVLLESSDKVLQEDGASFILLEPSTPPLSRPPITQAIRRAATY